MDKRYMILISFVFLLASVSGATHYTVYSPDIDYPTIREFGGSVGQHEQDEIDADFGTFYYYNKSSFNGFFQNWSGNVDMKMNINFTGALPVNSSNISLSFSHDAVTINPPCGVGGSHSQFDCEITTFYDDLDHIYTINSTGSTVGLDSIGATFTSYGGFRTYAVSENVSTNATYVYLPIGFGRDGLPNGLSFSWTDSIYSGNFNPFIFWGFREIWIDYYTDNVPPVVETDLDAIYYKAYETDGAYTIGLSLNYTDDFLVGNCWKSFDGGAYVSSSCGTNNGLFSSINMAGISLGSHTFQTEIFDNAGGSDESGVETFILRGTGYVDGGETYNAQTLEGGVETFYLNISFDSNYYTSSVVSLNYNNTKYTVTTSDTGNDRTYSRTINVNEVTADSNLTFYWEIELNNGTGIEYYNTTFHNQTVQNVLIDDCSVYTNLIYNFTVRDEEGRDILVGGTDNVTIEVDLRISEFGTTDEFLTYSKTFAYTNPATICLNLNLSDTDYRVDMEVGYNALDYVQEFYFASNETLSNDTSPHIDLHDLLATDSTTFLFTFINADGLEVEDAIVHTHRKYIGEGVFREVERSRSDDNGDTHVHLVEEDVIYYFTITLYDQLLFASSEYQAKCISTPCEIKIRAIGESSYDEDEWDRFDGGSYIITKNDSARTVTMTFITSPETSHLMDLTIYEFDNSGSDTVYVTGNSLTATSGTIELTIPASSGNSTFVYVLHADNELVIWGYFSLIEKGIDYFGGVLGVILSALVVLTLVLMAVTEGIAVLVFLILGLVLVSVLKLLDINWIALMSLIMAGAILIWKLTKRGERR